MTDIKFKLNNNTTSIYNWFIDNCMVESPVYSMVYIYAYRLISANEECNNKIIADKLNIFESDVAKAWDYWNKKGVITIKNNTIEFLAQREVEVVQNKPVDTTYKPSNDIFYNPSDINKLANDDKNIKDLLLTVEQLIGRTLSPNNASVVINMYDKLGLPYEVIVTLIQNYRDKGLAYIEKIAISWADKNIDTIDKAIAELNSYSVYYKILGFFGVNNRSYTEKEKEFMARWLNEYHFGLDIIRIACERTIDKLGKTSLDYANAILSNWSKNGVRTVSDIQKLDQQKSQSKQYNKQKENVNKDSSFKAPKNVFNSYSQKKYTDEEIEAILRRKANS